MGNPNNSLHPEIQIEYDVVNLTHDLLEHSQAESLNDISNDGKTVIQVYLNSLFENAAWTWDQMKTNIDEDLQSKELKKTYRRYLKESDFEIFYKFLDTLYNYSEVISLQKNTSSRIYFFALATLLIHFWLLKEWINTTSTSLQIQIATEIQDKIRDIITLSTSNPL